MSLHLISKVATVILGVACLNNCSKAAENEADASSDGTRAPEAGGSSSSSSSSGGNLASLPESGPQGGGAPANGSGAASPEESGTGGTSTGGTDTGGASTGGTDTGGANTGGGAGATQGLDGQAMAGSSNMPEDAGTLDAAGPHPTEVSRDLLSETGLYSDTASQTLAPGVQQFTPQFELWTDGAEKRRWIYLPAGEQVTTANVDEWKFPIGTKLWKEFVRDGKLIETRLLEKLPPERASEGLEGWLSMAYIWNSQLTDAEAAPDGAENVNGTDHDVPSQKACGQCHDMRREKPLGFSAVQLSHDRPGANITTLTAGGWLSHPITADLSVPGDATQQELLGFFHANCGHCHRRRAPVNNRVSSLLLWLESESLTSFEQSDAYQALVNAPTESAQGSIHPLRVLGGNPDESELMRRLLFRANTGADAGTVPPVVDAAPPAEGEEEIDVPMPPLGTEVLAPTVERVRQWVLSLPPQAEPPL